MDVKRIIESLLFVSKEPLSLSRLMALLPEIEPDLIRAETDALVDEYTHRNGGFHLVHVAGGYQFRTRPEWKTYVKRLNQASPLRLSRAALEALTIVAYKQPVIRSDIEHIRGVDSGGLIRRPFSRSQTDPCFREKRYSWTASDLRNHTVFP